MARHRQFGIVATLAAACLAACAPTTTYLRPTPTTSPSLSPAPTSTLPPATSTPAYPISAAFWDAQHGLLILTPGCMSSDNTCPGGVIERTDDAGKTWHQVDRTSASLSAIALSGNGGAWVSESGSGCGAGGNCTASTFLLTSDGGTTWADVSSRTPVDSVAPVSATTAWALAGSPGSPDVGTALVRTADGGRTWQPHVDPCSRVSGVGPATVSFAGPAHGWLVCSGVPATDMQPKALFSTHDGGTTWQLQSDTCLGSVTGQPVRSVGRLSCVGNTEEMSALPDGHGWMWMNRGSLSTTTNGGVTWSAIAANIVTDDINDALSVSLVSDADGFLLISRPESQTGCTPLNCGPQLLSTNNGGRTWTIMSIWSP